MQLDLVALTQNAFNGMLPEAWGNLTDVSHCGSILLLYIECCLAILQGLWKIMEDHKAIPADSGVCVLESLWVSTCMQR